MKKPSLALIPSGYKAGKVYSILPNNSVGDFTFIRNSGATRVNKDGLIENVGETIGSEEVTNGGFNTSSDWNVSGEDGTHIVTFNNSLRYQSDTTSPVLSVTQGSVFELGKIYKVKIEVSDITSGYVKTDAFGQSNSLTTSVGTVIIYGVATSSTLSILRGTTNVDVTIDSISVKEVLTEVNTPRLDYSDAGCPSLLLEPSRTNIVTHSEDFSNASWTKTNVDIETADIVSPSGELDATKMTINSTSPTRRIFDVLSTTIGLDYTFSLYVKKGNTDFIFALTSSGSLNATFNLTTLSATNGSIEDAGNGWYRIIGTFNALSVTEVIQIVLSNAASVGDFQYIYGAQVEQGSNATSYIPTNGATATRIGELCVDSMLDSPIITSDDWTLFFDLDSSDVKGVNKRISLSDGTNANRVLLSYNANTQVYLFQTINANVIYNSKAIILSTRAKMALVSTANGFDLYANGSFVSSKTDGRFDASSINRISFVQGGNSLAFEGKVYGLRYYDEAITSQEAIELTTL